MKKLAFIAVALLTCMSLTAGRHPQGEKKDGDERGRRQFTPPTLDPALTADETAAQSSATPTSAVADARTAAVSILATSTNLQPNDVKSIKNSLMVALKSLPRSNDENHRPDRESRPDSDDNNS